FDDIGTDGLVPQNYGGLDWSASSWFAFSGEQAPYTPHSGDFRVTAGFGASDADTTVHFGAGATFQGAWFAGFAEDFSGAPMTVTFELFNNGVQVGTSSALALSDTPTFLSSGYDGIVDTLIVSSGDQSLVTMDDFSFTQPVPEPETYALMLAGLGVVSFVARRRNKAA
ncbi:MAG: hypothetical protein JWP52_3444, partial [Rhizobacter sp.]|nr:hypothetical protein [Rhizobacter sp.]